MSPFVLVLVWITSFVLSASFPEKALGFYTIIADDTAPHYTSTSKWQPMLYDYQTNGSNVIWLASINPKTMPFFPYAMANLAKCRGKPGCPPVNVPVIASIGGGQYCSSASYWPWLQNQSFAIEMARNVSTWDKLYGIDGIDLDIMNPAGNSNDIGQNLVLFIKELKKLNSHFVITQPVYGYPQCAAQNDDVIASFTNAQSNNLIQSIGIAVFQDLSSLQWVGDWQTGSYDVPSQNIVVGIEGTALSSTITTMAQNVKSLHLGGIMVWYASVWDNTNNKSALNYGSDDATANVATYGSWANAKKILDS